MNKLFIVGNLTKDPDQRVTQQGVPVCSFTVAVNSRRETADYFRVTTWRELAESCGKYLSKGRKVCVVGSASLSTFQTQNGETRANIEVTAQDVEFLSPPDKPQTQEKKTGFVEVDSEELPF